MQVSANGVRIEVDIQGPASGEPLLMIMGLGMQLIAWPEGLVEQLVARGFRVIRFDNRDVGLSQPFDQLGVPNIPLAALLHTLRLPVKAPYQIADLARDAVGVLDALGIARAHVCGASMGGMIAQHMGFAHGQRLKSLTLMMTTSGARHLPKESLKVRRALLSRPRPGSTPEQKFNNIIDHYVGLYGVIGSPGYPPEPNALRERLARGVKRAFRPQAVARQLVAIAADGHRAERLPRIAVPTLIIHGQDDALIPLAAAHNLARRIPGLRFGP
jgi:pimeloyl-ACP methyl ester carboxylesterase